MAALLWPAAALARPTITAAGVVNAASYAAGRVSPGEVVVIYGEGLGPDEIAGLEEAGGRVTTELAGVRVLFDGVPAPLVYVLATQVSAIVPYAVAGSESTELVMSYRGESSAPVTLPVVETVPGLFTIDASGFGPGAILNQDGSVNSAENPADLGEIVVLYATGEGQTDPGGQDGLIAVSDDLPAPILPVAVQIGGEDADLVYAGAAPLLVAGVMQVNAHVPTTIPNNLATTAEIQVGETSSREDVTLAVVSQPDALAPGATTNLYGAVAFYNPEFPGVIQADNLLPFEVRNAAGAVVLSGTVQDRNTLSNQTGKLTFAPRIRDLNDFGSGARIVALEKSGFTDVDVRVEYRTDGSGSVRPATAARSEDGSTISFTYTAPFRAPDEGYFLSILTDATAYVQTGRITIRAAMPDGSQLSAAIDGAVAPE